MEAEKTHYAGEQHWENRHSLLVNSLLSMTGER